MKKRTLIIAIVVAGLLSVAAAVGARVMFATGVGPAVGDCKTYQIADTGGKVSFPVPLFCREKICEISVGWWGETVGAYNPGLSWEINFIQWNDGNWQAGPAACIGGACLSDGHGHNGDAVEEAVLGPYQTYHEEDEPTSYFQLWDDQGTEHNRLKMTFQMGQADPANPEFTSVILFICPN